MTKNLYDILNVSKDASKEDIKKAYKKLALSEHPDRSNNPNANEIFAEINGAYEILSDEEKRRNYDNGGVNLFAQMFQHNPFQHSNPRSSPEPIIIQVDLTLEEICNGCEKTLFFDRFVITDEHKKTVVSPEVSDNCAQCNGTGQILQQLNMGPMIMHAVGLCPGCQGEGKILKVGFEYISKKCKIHHHFPKGLLENQQIVFKYLGNMSKHGGSNGSIILVIHHVNEPHMKSGVDNVLYYTHSLNIFDMLIGTTIDIPHPDGNVITTTTNPLKVGEQILLNGVGLPTEHGTSNLIISFDVVYPILTEEEKNALRSLFHKDKNDFIMI